jgi:hypothetical protein
MREQGSEAITQELRDKIKSKMDVAKFFAAFIAISISLSSGKLPDWISDTRPICYLPPVLGIFLIVASLAFSIATMYAYDRLLMPPEFWEVNPKETLNEILFKEMKSAWINLFRYAVYTFFGGLLCFFTCVLMNTNYFSIIGLWIVPIIVIIIYEKYSNIGDKIHG